MFSMKMLEPDAQAIRDLMPDSSNNIDAGLEYSVEPKPIQKKKKTETSMSIAEILDNSNLMLDDSDSAVKLSVARDPNFSAGQDFAFENPLSMRSFVN